MEQGHHNRLLPLELSVLSKYRSHFFSQVQKECYNDDDDDDNDDVDDDFLIIIIIIPFQFSELKISYITQSVFISSKAT
jgi:hypothetical protein